MSLSDTILEVENIRTCPVCYKEDNLRILRCNHVECSECIEKELNTARENGTHYKCPVCRTEHAGVGLDEFPVAELAIVVNRAAYANRVGDANVLPFPTAMAAMASLMQSVAKLFTDHHLRIDLMEDEDEREKAKEDSNSYWEWLNDLLTKFMQSIKETQVWIAERWSSLKQYIKYAAMGVTAIGLGAAVAMLLLL